MTDLPRITSTPARPDEVFIHLPEFTYWDTQAWSAELGIPTAHLPALRDAINAWLDATPAAEGGERGPFADTCTHFSEHGWGRCVEPEGHDGGHAYRATAATTATEGAGG